MSNTAPSTSQETRSTIIQHELQSTLHFPVQPVLILGEKDFALGTQDKIALKEITDCTMILFHVNNKQSQDAMAVWLNVAVGTAGPIFAAVNMVTERKVAEAFANLAMELNHPLHPFSLRGYPTILIYQKRYPVGVYNGIIGTTAITNWALTYACQGDYNERRNAFPGQEIDSDLRLAEEGRREVDTTITRTSYDAAQSTVPFAEKTTARSTQEESAAPQRPGLQPAIAIPASSLSTSPTAS